MSVTLDRDTTAAAAAALARPCPSWCSGTHDEYLHGNYREDCQVWHRGAAIDVAADIDGNRVDVHISGTRHLNAKDDWPDTVNVAVHNGDSDAPWQACSMDAADARRIGQALIAAAESIGGAS